MELPVALLNKLDSVKGFNRETFERVHTSGETITSVRFNPAKLQPHIHSLLAPLQQVLWSSCGYYLEKRPSFIFDPLWHAGVYYVQEASSMFLEHAFKQCIDITEPLKVLDLCAAPGGKSTLLQSVLSKESVLVANEVIKTRVTILEENLVKWGGDNVIITNSDPANFSRLTRFFDVVVIDAPCSGSGLFRRDPEAIAEWSESNVQLCSERQQRIINDIWPCLKEGGVLIYSTCSYSQEEDEAIVNWVIEQKEASVIELTAPSNWGLVSSCGGFRFYPDKLKGEGFFIAAVRKNEGGGSLTFKTRKAMVEKPVKEELDIARKWVKTDAATTIVKFHDVITAISAEAAAVLSTLQQALYLKRAGIAIGKQMKKELVPSHEWALGGLMNDEVPAIDLNRHQAIAYLQRRELSLPDSRKGWFAAHYQNYPLGWMKLLGNRINNYYPLNWRILTSKNENMHDL